MLAPPAPPLASRCVRRSRCPARRPASCAPRVLATLQHGSSARPAAKGLPGLALASTSGLLASTGFSLEGPESVATALAVLAGIIFVHELGHFSAARALGVHVTRFAVGFGPALLRWKGPTVEYSLGLVPLGGFVAFPDDDPESPFPKDDPDLLRNRPLAHRAAVVSAGVAANCVAAFLLLTTQAATVGQAVNDYLPGVRVPLLLSRSAAGAAGVLPGDIILAVDGQAVAPTADSVSRLVRAIADAGGRPLRLTLERAGAPRPFTLDVTPDRGAGGGRIGVQLEANVRVSHRVAASPLEAVTMASSDFVRLTGVVTGGLTQLVTNFAATAEQLSGPVAIVAVGAKVVEAGDAAAVFQFASILNLNLAVVNSLPLPALDGGFLALLAVEAARGKRLEPEVEQTFSALGLLALVGSGLVLLVRDSLKLLDG